MEAVGIGPKLHGSRNHLNPDHNFTGARVLLAEDNEANQLVAEELLTRAGISLEIVENGRLALEKVKRTEYDAILMDMQMPEMDGMEATRLIRQYLAGKPLPIIAMTANAMKGDREQCLEAGMDDYVSKPIDRAELFRTLHRWLAGHPARQHDQWVASQGPNALAQDGPAPVTALPALAGVNVEAALNRLGLPLETYLQMLRRFREIQSQILERLAAAVSVSDLEAVRLHAHSLAGAAGNISAERLQAAGKALETKARNQDCDLAESYREVVIEARIVFAALEALPAQPEPAESPDEPPGGASFDPEPLSIALEKLSRDLSACDLQAITESLRAVVASAQGAPQAQYQKMARLIDDYEYQEAQEVLREIQERLKGRRDQDEGHE